MLKRKPLKGKNKIQNHVSEFVLSDIASDKNMLAFIADNIDAYVWTVDKDFQFVFCNKALLNVIKLVPDDPFEYFFFDFISNENRIQIIEEVKKRVAHVDQNQFTFQFDLVIPDKSVVSLKAKVNLFRAKNEVFDGFICIAEQVKDVNINGQSKKEKEANLVAQIENTVDSIWSVDTNFCITNLNTNFKEYFQSAFGVELVIGSCIVGFLPEPFNTEWISRYNKALSGERFSVTDHFTFEDVPQYVEVSFHPIQVGNKAIGVSCFSRDITTQKLTEIAIVESENKYKALVANIPSVSYRCKITDDWMLDFVSDEVMPLSGYAPEEFMNNDIRAFSGIIHPEDKKMVENHIMNSLHKREGYKLDYRIVHKNGAVKWVSERGRASFNDKGKVEWLSGVISDITQKVHVLDDLQKSEEKFRQIFEQSNAAMSIQTQDQILMVNKAWEKITGFSFDEALKMKPTDFIHPQVRADIQDKIDSAYEGAVYTDSFILHAMDKDRNDKWVDASISMIDYEDQKAVLLIGTDITDRKNSELEINKLSTGIMNSPSSIVITDIDGNIEYVNPFFCESTGYSREEVLGGNPRILQSGGTSDEVFAEMWGTILRGEVWYGEFENKKKNGEKYWERARIAPIKDENNIIVSFVAIKEDVTEQKRYQEMIEQSETDLRELNAKKDKFFSIIAHDLRSPFVGLVGLTDILNSNYDDLSEEKIKHYLKFANESAHNVFRLLETLLEWAKSQTGRMEFRLESIDLTGLIQDAFGIASLSAKSKDINLVNFAYNSTKVVADKNMIFTILRNLVSNAIKYTPRNGRVSIDVKDEEKRLIVSVSDTGVGIPKDKQNKLFRMDENYTTIGTEKEKGSGLGLLLCKEFIERHGGEIWCESAADNGSVFFFSIPKRKL